MPFLRICFPAALLSSRDRKAEQIKIMTKRNTKINRSPSSEYEFDAQEVRSTPRPPTAETTETSSFRRTGSSRYNFRRAVSFGDESLPDSKIPAVDAEHESIAKTEPTQGRMSDSEKDAAATSNCEGLLSIQGSDEPRNAPPAAHPLPEDPKPDVGGSRSSPYPDTPSTVGRDSLSMPAGKALTSWIAEIDTNNDRRESERWWPQPLYDLLSPLHLSTAPEARAVGVPSSWMIML